MKDSILASLCVRVFSFVVNVRAILYEKFGCYMPCDLINLTNFFFLSNNKMLLSLAN